jgi:hypothetical protein
MAISPEDLQALAAEVRRQDQAANGLITLMHPDRGRDTDAKGVVPGSTVETHYRKLGFITETELLARRSADAKLQAERMQAIADAEAEKVAAQSAAVAAEEAKPGGVTRAARIAAEAAAKTQG